MAACGATGPEAVPFVFLVGAMFASLAIVAAFESRGRRDPADSGNLLQRWVLGAGLWALGTALGGLVIPGSSPEGGWVFTGFGCLPPVVQCVVLVVSIDYVQTMVHRALHRVPMLWRLHAIHHGDRHFDTATSLRFHPAETLLRAGVDAVLVLCLGPAPLALASAVIFLTVWNVLDHGRVSLPPALGRALERLLVTPDVHRLHHARERSLQDRNFGGVFTLWDRCFGSYLEPGDRAAAIGLDRWPAGDDLLSNLVAPIRASDR